MQNTPTAEQIDRLVFGLQTTRETLVKTLAQLWEDAPGDAEISDSHDRFFQHCTLLAWAGNTWPALKEELDEVGFANNRDANLIAKEAIWRVVITLAK